MKNLLACAIVLGICFPAVADTLCPQYAVADYGAYKYFFAWRCPAATGAYWVGAANTAVPTGPCSSTGNCFPAYTQRAKADDASHNYGASSTVQQNGVTATDTITYTLGVKKNASGTDVGVLGKVRDPFIAELKKKDGGDAGLIKVHVLVFTPLNGEAAFTGAIAHYVSSGTPVAKAKQFHNKDKEWHFEVDVPDTTLKNMEGQIIRHQ